MRTEEIKETHIWGLYEKGRNFHRMMSVYSDTDRNYRMYNGNQWEGAKLGGIEPVQINFIKPIVKYKLSVIHSNLYSINYSSQNFTNKEFAVRAKGYCAMLNRYAHRIWEHDQMDKKGREITRDAAINDEGIIYVDFDREKMMPINTVVKKADIYYGNENDDNIQTQPYILIRKRMSVSEAVEFALSKGVSAEATKHIVGDKDNYEESGEDAKQEVNDGVTLVYKLYRMNGTLHYSVSSRYLDIVKDTDIGIKLYPIAHFNWEKREGSARGEGEVRNLIPNQIEVNRTEMRRVLTVKNQAYPYKVVDTSKISNPDALNTVGATIKTKGQGVDDVRKLVNTISPAQMSSDVKQVLEELIQTTRELAGAGDVATGQVNPETASGKAILAVQQASQAPMTEQREAYKSFLEDLARIYLEYLIEYSQYGLDLEEETRDEAGNETVQIVRVPQSVLRALQATVKIDITPKGVFDKFAQEMTIENLLKMGMFTAQRLPELKAYFKALDDDSVAPKQQIGEIIEYMEEEQRKISMIQAEAEMMQQRYQQFLMGDDETQSSQMADAMAEIEAEETETAEEEVTEEI